MTTDDLVLSLAPLDLPLRRPLRFDGAGLTTPLARFCPADRARLLRVYRDVEGLSLLRRSMGREPDWDALARRAAALGEGTLIDEAQALGAACPGDAGTRKALHDVRGGGLAVLLGLGQMLALRPGEEALARTCVAAARDHAKIMRCLVPDLDPPARAADEAAKAHGIGHFTDKWRGARLAGPRGPAPVSVRCSYEGGISARCLETASIDRVLYNLVNNAARFADGGGVELVVLPVGGGLTRWAVANRVAEDERAFLAGRDLRALFAGGTTRGGSGIGLANCAEVVAECFGLARPEEAAGGGYVGAALRGSLFLAWFHWPAWEGRAADA